jgi:tetratricopeptide (TPR) repeat protein
MDRHEDALDKFHQSADLYLRAHVHPEKETDKKLNSFAANLYIRCKEFAKAGEIFLAEADYLKAGECFKAAKKFEKAAICFEKASIYERDERLEQKPRKGTIPL